MPTTSLSPESITSQRRAVVVPQLQARAGWLYAFLALQFICQSALMAEGLGGRWRIYFRALTFASSLGMLLLLPGRAQYRHPALKAGLASMGIMGLSLLHPNSNTLSGIAHWLLNISIWAPLFWVGRIAVTPQVLWRAMLMLWGFHTLSSVVGVLQVYYPQRFAPSAEFVRSLAGQMADGLLITLDDGRQVWRPFGLSDTPGGAASSGSFAAIAGLVLFISTSNIWIRLIALCGIVSGIFCIYICEVRSIMAITIISGCAMILVQVMQKRITRAAATVSIAILVLAGAVSWTHSISQKSAQRRVRTLTETSISNVYYRNRGVFIENAIFEDLPKYPLGAGAGRWGMMYTYFGDPTQPHSTALWSEIQLTGWLYDGGIPLCLLAYGAVISACIVTFKIAIKPQNDRFVRDCAGIVTALNAGWLVVTLSYPLFIGQGGMIFWLMNAAVFAASTYRPRHLSSRDFY